MFANKPTVYMNWGYYQWLLIQSLLDDDNTLVFKVRMLNEIEKPSYRYYMLRCEIELMEEHRLVSKMRQTSVVSIHMNLWSGRQASCLGRGQKLWYEKTINKIIKREQLFFFGDRLKYKLDKRVTCNKEYFKNM